MVVSAMTTVSPADRPLTIWISVAPTAPVTTRLVETTPLVTTSTRADPELMGVTADAGTATAASTVLVVMVVCTRDPSGSASPPDATVITVA